jgi:hypothetical protein
VSSFNLDEREKAKQFASYFKQLEDRLAALERSNQLNNASIEGGALDIYDEDGALKGSVGVQDDGTVALVPHPENTDPPPTPSAPTVDSALAGLDITWSGQWANSETAPNDFALVQVHVGTPADFTPNAATQVSQINDVTGGKTTVHIEGYDPVWVRLVAVNTAALAGDPSDAVQGQARQAVGQDLIDNIITDVKIANEAITEAKIALSAVTSDKIAAGSVNELLLADDAVTAAKLAAASVGTVALADGAVLAAKLADNAVTQAKVAANAVTELALANSAVTSAKVAVGAIDSTRIADAAVTAVKIGQNAVTAAKLADGAVGVLALADSAVTSAKVAVGAIDSTRIADAAVTAVKIGQNAVTAAKLADGAVGVLALADSAVTSAKVAVNAIDSTKITDAAVTAAKIGAAAVTTGKLAAQAVTLANLSGALADVASQRWVDTMGDPSTWTVAALSTGGAFDFLTGITDAQTGQTVGQATGFARLRGNTLIPYDPDVLYRISARVRMPQASTSDAVYVGVLGIGADGVTLVNRDGSNSVNSHYYPAASGKAVANSDGWVTVVGFMKGRAASGVSGSAGPNNDPRSAGLVNAGVRFISPYIWLNYNQQSSGSSKMQMDYVAIEALKTGVVDTINLSSGAVTAPAIATDAVIAGKIAADAITARELAANSVTAAELSAGSVTAAAIAAGTITAGQLAANSVTATQIAAGSVQTAALAADAVAAGKIAADAITARELAANSVTAAELSAGSVTAAAIAAGTITAGQLAANSVTATQIAAGAVQAGALAADAVAAGKVAADAITARELAAGSVTASEISAGSVTANAIAAGSVTTDKLTVVAGSNVLNDPSFEGAYAASVAAKFSSYVAQDLTFGNGSAASLKFTTDGTAAWRAAELALLTILPGDQLHIGVDYYASTNWVGAGGEINIQIRWESEGGTILSYSKTDSRTTAPTLGAWTRLQGTYTAPATAVRARIRIETGLVTAGTVSFDNAVCRPIVPGVQIADGAITTPKMVAGSIQGDRIAVNTLNADRIVSGSITTSQLNVTTAASVLQKFYDVGADAAKWRTSGSSTTTTTTPTNLTSVQVADAQAGGSVMRAVAQVSAAWRPDMLIPFDPNVLYRISAVVRQTVAGSDTAQQRFYMGVAGVAADGTTLVNTTGAASAATQHYVAASSQNLTAGGGWQRFTGYIKGYAATGANGTQGTAPSPTAPGVLHANARYISPLFYVNYSGGTGTAEISSITVEVIETGAVQTVNIADGAITANKILANTITADKIVGLSITGDKIAANAITTDKLAALSVTAVQLAANSVTATAIQAGSIDATHIKAGAITADRLSLGTDGNLIADPSFEGAMSDARVVGTTYWSIVTPGNNTARALQVNAANGTVITRSMTLATVPGMPGQKLWLSLDYFASTDWNGLRISVYGQWLDAVGNVLDYSTITTGDNLAVKGAWTTISGVPDTVAPAGATQLRIACSTVNSSVGTVQYDNASARIVLASGFAGARSEISPRGLQLFDDNGDEAVSLLTGQPNYLTLSADGLPVATIDQNGGAYFQSLAVADTLTVGGSDWTTFLNQSPRGIQAINFQTSTRTASATEMGFVELVADIDATRMYRIVFAARANPSVTGGELQLRLRDGGTAAPTITSTQRYVSVHHMALGNSFTARMEYNVAGKSLGAGTHRFLLTFTNALGPSGQTCTLSGASDNPGYLYVEDTGPYVPATGGYNDGGGTVAQPPTKYTKTYSATWSGSYANRGSYNSYYGNSCYQGYYSSTNGTQASLIGFSSALGTDLSGATIVKAEVYLYFDHWYANAGGKAVIKAHSFTSRPSTFSSDPESQTISWARNEGKWVDITAVFDSTKWRGIALDPNSTSSTYYGRARGYGQTNPPQLRVTYTK